MSERRRLLAFIRRRIPDEIDAEDLLQDVFCELVEAYRLMKPVAHAGAWMMQVAKNRITDLFRRRQTKVVEDGGRRILEDLLPSSDAGPDMFFARGVLLAEIEAALGELPLTQREVFLAHEIDGLELRRDLGANRRGPEDAALAKTLRRKASTNRLQRVYDESGYEGRGK